MMITVYGRNTSVNVQAVMWCIAELGLDHERLDFGGAFGKTDTPDYRSMNPHGLVPTIKDGETVVWESAAIIRYLACKYGDDAFWPREPGKRAGLDMWAEWARSTIYPDFISTVFIQSVRTAKSSRNFAAVAAAEARLGKSVPLLDARMGEGPWLGGEAFTFADIACGVLMHRYFTLEHDRADVPNLKTYYERLLARPAYAAHVAVSFESLRHPEA
jgi:glutathione S-transferase